MDQETLYQSFLDELEKIAASGHRLAVPKTRVGRRSMRVTTMLKKDGEGTLFKHAWQDQLPGGLADNKTPSDFPAMALRQGKRVESEHTSRPALAAEIAMDHLAEDPKYYRKLERVEKRAYTLQGHTEHQGLPIAIENRVGSVRSGVDKDGKPWRTKFKYPYGYLKGTKGKDGEEIDVYVGPNDSAPKAYVVHQRHIDGTGHDEDKVMLGFGSKGEARAAYLDHYNKAGPKLLGPISTMTVDALKEKLEEKRQHTKLAWDGTGSGSGPTGNRMAMVDMDEKPDRTKPGDVPSRDGTSPGAARVERHEAGPDFATTLPTNGAMSSSSTGATTRL